MTYTSETIEKIVSHFAGLPGIGRKTAQRLVYHLLRQPDDLVGSFAAALIELKQKVKYCSSCYNYTEIDPCPICASPKRDRTTICVVEEPNDVVAIEKTNEFRGMYHVLHGVMNPLEGVTQDDIKLHELLQRLAGVEEIILALNPSVEGEVTTQYIAKLLKPLSIKATRIARGLPVGSDLEYADQATITRAIEDRTIV